MELLSLIIENIRFTYSHNIVIYYGKMSYVMIISNGDDRSEETNCTLINPILQGC